MAATFPDGPRLLYMRYKRLGKEIYSDLDPEEKLPGCNFREAKQVACDLVKSLPENQRAKVFKQVKEAKQLRIECGRYYKARPLRERIHHSMYIRFLEKIEKQLSEYLHGQGAVHIPKIDQQSEEAAHPAGEESQQVKTAGSEEDKEIYDDKTNIEEADNDEDNNKKSSLTPDGADFIAFLELLINLAEKAAAVWTEVAEGKLPIWVASILSNIYLNEADKLVNIESVLDEDSQSKKRSPTKWAATITPSKERFTPRLTQSWVDVLNEAGDAASVWRELIKPLPLLTDFFASCVMPAFQAKASKLPMSVSMLAYGSQMLKGARSSTHTLPAQVPLTTIIGVYFYDLVTRDQKFDDTFKAAARNAVRDTLNDNRALMPRLVANNCFSTEQADSLRRDIDEMVSWAGECSDPVSLGQIHFFARAYWVDWHARLVASNTVSLQVLLYLYEKLRLESDEYEILLLEDLMTDPRVAPALLMNGRPTTVHQVIQALQKWCCVWTEDGETMASLEERTPNMNRSKLISNSVDSRNLDLLSMDIAFHDYGLNKDTLQRVSTREGNDADALRRYLIWEMSAPNCLKLEAALYEVLRKLPEGRDALTNSILAKLSQEPRSLSKWLQAIRDIIDKGIHTVLKKASWGSGMIYGKYQLSHRLQIAVLNLAVGGPDPEKPLEAAIAEVFPTLQEQSQDSFALDLVKKAMQDWLKTLADFNIETLLRDHVVQTQACVACLLPSNAVHNETKEGRNKGRTKRQNRKSQSQTKKEGKPWNEAMRGLLKDFIEEAKPILEEAYGKIPGTSACDIEGMTGSFTT